MFPFVNSKSFKSLFVTFNLFFKTFSSMVFFNSYSRMFQKMDPLYLKLSLATSNSVLNLSGFSCIKFREFSLLEDSFSNFKFLKFYQICLRLIVNCLHQDCYIYVVCRYRQVAATLPLRGFLPYVHFLLRRK